MAKQGPRSGPTPDIDTRFHQWLGVLAKDWRMTVDAVALNLGIGEIANRTKYYPEIGALLRGGRFSASDVGRPLRKCWALLHRFDAIHLSAFLDSGKAKAAISRLVDDFPRSDSKGAERIDWFVERATGIGFSRPTGNADRAGAALLAGVLLTASYPGRFVDYRQVRWAELAEVLGYDLPDGESYGGNLLRAGQFAGLIAETKTFRKYWPDEKPLWVLSGICWMGSEPDKPEDAPPAFDEDEGFPEGKLKEVLHLAHERNRTVIRRAKELAWRRDPSLPCDVCEFSFVDTYGPIGERMIEAHHRKPVAALKRGHRTMVEDIALVCANCHRMLHRGDRTLTVEELRDMLKK